MRVIAAAPEDFAWIAERTGCVPGPGFRAIKVVDSRGKIRGMVGYDGWTENAVQAHMAVDTPVAWRSLVRPAFSYPFEEAGRGIILATISARNLRSVHLALRFGFRLLHRIKDGQAVGRDLLLLEMRREQCRWLGPQEGGVNDS